MTPSYRGSPTRLRELVLATGLQRREVAAKLGLSYSRLKVLMARKTARIHPATAEILVAYFGPEAVEGFEVYRGCNAGLGGRYRVVAGKRVWL